MSNSIQFSFSAGETLNRIFQTENVPDTTVGTAHSSDGSSDVAIIELLEPAASTSAASTNSVVPTHSIDGMNYISIEIEQ